MWMVGLEYAGADDAVDGVSGDVLLQGIGVSAGSAEGRVRIVRDQSDLDGLGHGEILVCQVASPAWVPVLPISGALVADGGGALSHAAIAAREHGIPAVLGTRDGTTQLSEGQLVRVDGAAGTVTDATESKR